MTNAELTRRILELEHKLRHIVVSRCDELPTTNVGKLVIYNGDLYFWNGTNYEEVLTEDDLAGLVTEAELAWLTTDIQGALVNANTPSAINPYATLSDIAAIPDPITVVANYAALPPANTVTGQFYWAEAAQGTSWLPGSLGGTYYPLGIYYSNGTTWAHIETLFQATQAEVNTGTNDNKFVTPLTLANSTAVTDKTNGTGIANQVAFWTGAKTLAGDPDLTYDSINNRLSFGTASGAGRINLPDAGTTAADGISFGSNVSLYRLGSTVLAFSGAEFTTIGGAYMRTPVLFNNSNYNQSITLSTPDIKLSSASGVSILPASLTGSSATSALNIVQTYNTTGSPTTIFVNVTDTASGANTNFLDLQRNSVSQFRVNKNGFVQIGTAASLGSLSSVAFGIGSANTGFYRDSNRLLISINGVFGGGWDSTTGLIGNFAFFKSFEIGQTINTVKIGSHRTTTEGLAAGLSGNAVGDVGLCTNNTARIVALFNGNVGIGTASPTSRLQVIGLPTHSDNAAAIIAGLTAGAFFHNGDGVLRVVF